MIRVLMVDDDPAVLEITKVFLERSGDIQVDAVVSALEATERLQDGGYDVIVSDYVMPEMDGISFLKRVRSRDSEIPFILFTGKGREEVVIEALNNGADYYLQKDANPKVLYAELTHQIRQAAERQKAKKAVIESEEKYRALFENMNDGLVLCEFVLDVEGRVPVDYVIKDANPQIEEIAGVGPDEAIGKRGSEIFGSIVPPFLETYRQVDETGSPAKFDGRIPETGRQFSISAYSMGRGEFAAIFSDVTEEKRVNEELCRAHHQLQEIIDFLPDATFVVDEERKVIAWNRAVEEMTGVSKDQIIGRGAYDYGEPFYGFKRPVLIDAIFSEDSGIERDYDYLRRQGDAIFAEVYIPHLYGGRGAYIWAIASPLFDDDGRVVGAIESIRDVTDRKGAEVALRETRDYLESLLHRANAPIAVWGPNMKIIRFNRAFERLTGYAAGEVIGREATILLPDEGREEALAKIAYTLEGECWESVEIPVRCKDGGVRIVLWNSANIRSEKDGAVIATIIQGQDITERKRAEEDLILASKQLQEIIDFLPDPTFVIDAERKVIAWNRAIEEMTGVGKDEMVGRGDYAYGEVFYGERRPVLIDMIFSWDQEQEALYHYVKKEGETLFAEAFVIPPRTGKGSYVWGTASPLFDKDGNITGAIESIRDVTEIKETEMALQENEERLKLVIEGASLGIWDRNVVTGEVVRNRRLVEIFGCPDGELSGHVRDREKMIHPDDFDKVMAALEDHFLGKTPHYEIDYRLRRRDGRWIWVHDCGEVMARDEAGQPLRMVGITQEITEIRRYQEALKEANRKLNLLSRVTRHDILNQITALSGYAHLLREIVPQDQAAEKYIDRIGELVKTIHEQLVFTRDYQAMGVKAPEWQRVSDVLRRAKAAAPAESAAGEIGFDVSTENLEVFADPMLEKVFTNLMENAARHGGSVSEIRVFFIERAKGGEEGDGGEGGAEGVIVVEDDGAGVPAEVKTRIFDQAFGRHTGYGLFLSREILGITGMTIAETGEEGKGARFEISVPEENYRWE
ncbi:MAG: Multi-sensor signal transduction histidine kinase [Methanothrix sp.]|nr:MAG: Multi-sensor signal transduction histidine kinase [Methanothrix sp.]